MKTFAMLVLFKARQPGPSNCRARGALLVRELKKLHEASPLQDIDKYC